MTLQGTIVNGQIVLNQPQSLAAGAKVRVEIKPTLLEPQDDWERRLRAIPIDCGVALSDGVLSREELYD
ncbi:MAG: hypothetical protein HYX68_12290 [Planctomycetes bacterium]|nr:hypothetical protein [Planctomycetota bacterium]